MLNRRIVPNIQGDLSLEYVNSNGTNVFEVTGLVGIPFQSGAPNPGDIPQLSIDGSTWNLGPLTINGDIIGTSEESFVIGLSGLPIIGSPPSDGQVLTSIILTNIGNLNVPTDVAVNRLNASQSAQAGLIYVTDTYNNRIMVYNSNGLFQNQWGIAGSGVGNFSSPEGVAIDASGNVYVVDTLNQRVQKFNGTGTYLGSIGSSGSANGHFMSPVGICIAAPGINGGPGYPIVTDALLNNVQAFDSNGNLLSVFGVSGSGNGQFSSAAGIDYYSGPVATSGTLYIADTSNSRVQVLTMPLTGVATSGWHFSYASQFGVVGSGNGQFYSPYGVCYDAVAPVSSGAVYVTDYQLDRVQQFDVNGTYLGQAGTKGGGNIQFQFPLGLDYDNLGNLYIADAGNSRIEKLDSNGNFITSWGNAPTENTLQYVTPTLYGDVTGPAAANTVTSIGGIPIANLPNTVGNTLNYVTNNFPGQFNSPTSLAISSAGNVLLLNAGSTNINPAGIIEVYSPSGIPLSSFGSTVLSPSGTPAYTGLTVDSVGNIYVYEQLNVNQLNATDLIVKFNPNGTWLDNIALHPFSNTGTITVDVSGFLHLAYNNFGVETTVITYTGNGTLVGSWATPQALGAPYQTGNTNSVLDSTSSNIFITMNSTYQVAKFTTAGSLVTQWGSYGNGNGQFRNLSCIAVDTSNNIYITDSVLNRVQKFTSSGTYITQWGSQGPANGQFNNPTAIIVDSLNYVYVLDAGNNRIEKFTSNGTYVTQWGTVSGANAQLVWGNTTTTLNGDVSGPSNGNYLVAISGIPLDITGTPTQGQSLIYNASISQPISPLYITLDNSNNIYVTSDLFLSVSGSPQVVKFNSTGGYVSSWNLQGSVSSSSPQGIVADSANSQVWVVNEGLHNVQSFTLGGVYNGITLTGGGAGGNFVVPWGIGIDTSNNIYINDSNGIRKFNSAGTFQTYRPYDSGAGEGFGGGGVAVSGAGGSIYSANGAGSSDNKIWYGPIGTALWTTIGNGTGSANGYMNYPQGIALDSFNNIYIVDSANYRIQKFSSTGTYISQFGSYGSGNTEFLGPTGIAIDNSNNIYVTDTTAGVIKKFNSSFSWLANIGVAQTAFISFGSTSSSPAGPAGGDLAGTYPNPQVVALSGVPIANVPSISGQVPTYNSSNNTIMWQALPTPSTQAPYGSGINTIAQGNDSRLTYSNVAHSTLVPNGSFEYSDVLNVPNNWTIIPYSGGSSSLGHTNSVNGSTALQLISTGLTGGGGAKATSLMMPISSNTTYAVEFQAKASTIASTIPLSGSINWYDYQQNLIPGASGVGYIYTNYYGGQNNITTNFGNYGGSALAPTTAQWMSISFDCGLAAPSGSVWIDAVQVVDPLTVCPVRLVGKSLGAGTSVTATISNGVCTVTHSAHGYSATDGIVLAGTATTGTFAGLHIITSVTTNTYTFNTSASGTVTSPVEFYWFKGLRSINMSKIANIVRSGTGILVFTFTNAQPDQYYNIQIGNMQDPNSNRLCFAPITNGPGTTGFTITFFDMGSGGGTYTGFDPSSGFSITLTGII